MDKSRPGYKLRRYNRLQRFNNRWYNKKYLPWKKNNPWIKEWNQLTKFCAFSLATIIAFIGVLYMIVAILFQLFL